MNIVRDLASRIESLEMSYRGKKIETATVTRVLFWNAGRETIHGTDMAEADPLTIRTKKGCEILDARVTQMKKPANQFTVVLGQDSEVRIGFDYIDRNEGAVIQLIHTGRSSDDIQVLGTIKGVGTLARRSAYVYTIGLFSLRFGITTPKRRRHLTGALLILLGTIFPLMILLMPQLSTRPKLEYFDLIIASTFSIFYCGLGISFLRRRIPSGFDAFEMEF